MAAPPVSEDQEKPDKQAPQSSSQPPQAAGPRLSPSVSALSLRLSDEEPDARRIV